MKRSRFNLRILAASLVVTAAFIPTRPARAIADYISPRNADIDARGAASVRVIAGAGELRIEGRSGISQVRVRGTARASSRSRLDAVRLIAERQGDVVYIKADIPDGSGCFWRGNWGDNAGLDLVIEVPQSLALDVDDGSGGATFFNVGALKLSDGSGDIEVRGAKGAVAIKDGSGNMTIQNVEGSVHISDGSGNISATNVVGDFTVDDDGSGDIDITGVGGTVKVGNDGSGNIAVDRVAGDFIVDHKGSGGIRSRGVRGRIEIPERHRRNGY